MNPLLLQRGLTTSGPTSLNLVDAVLGVGCSGVPKVRGPGADPTQAFVGLVGHTEICRGLVGERGTTDDGPVRRCARSRPENCVSYQSVVRDEQVPCACVQLGPPSPTNNS